MVESEVTCASWRNSRPVWHRDGVDEVRADQVMLEPGGHLANGESLLAWTMRWCAGGDPEFEAVWKRTTDAKGMLNVPVAVRAVRSVAVRSSGAGGGVRFVVIRANDGTLVDETVMPGAMPGVIRRRFAVPALSALIDAGHRSAGKPVRW